MNIIERHSCLPIELYVHEPASLNRIFFLCENQYSEIAQKRHYKCQSLLSVGRFYDYHHCHYTNLSLGKRAREIVTLDVITLTTKMDYGSKRLFVGTVNL